MYLGEEIKTLNSGGIGVPLAIGGAVLLVPSLVGAMLGGMFAPRGDGTSWALVGAVIAPLVFFAMSKSK